MKNTRTVPLLVVSLVCCLAPEARGQDYRVYRLGGTITVDGKPDEAVWASVPTARGFSALSGAMFVAKQSSFKVAWDRDNLYVAITAEEPDMKSLRAKAKDGGSVWEDDGFELFLAPTDSDVYYQFLVNTAAARLNTKNCTPGPLWGWEAKVHKAPSSYSVEMKIPLEAFPAPPTVGAAWRANIIRNTFTCRDRISTWSTTGPSYHDTSQFRRFRFKGDPPAKGQLAAV